MSKVFITSVYRSIGQGPVPGESKSDVEATYPIGSEWIHYKTNERYVVYGHPVLHEPMGDQVLVGYTDPRGKEHARRPDHFARSFRRST